MRVLLAHDGSHGSGLATNLVKDLAWPPGSSLRVISVVEPTMLAPTGWLGGIGAYSPEVDAQISAYFEGELAEVVNTLTGPNRTVEGALLRGRPASVIDDDARSFGADLIVLGSRGRGSIESLVLGSVSGEVVDHAAAPVLVARQAGLSRIVLATDGSPSASAAEALLATEPVFAGLPIRVVSVTDVEQPWHTGIAPMMYRQVIDAYEHDLAAAREAHQRLADDSASRLRDAGQNASAEMRTGDSASEIIAAADAWKADLVVLGSRGRTGLIRLLLGSVARNVLHGSGASILVVRDADDA
jgi:nucleotide-binding universal stress UspA family protein